MSGTIKLTKTQSGVIQVLESIIAQVKNSEEDALVYAEELEEMLNYLQSEDFFGTEGQTDPRGDQRDGNIWTVYKPQAQNQ